MQPTNTVPKLLEICRVTTITILEVTLTNHFSISEHVTDIISKCAQSLYALKFCDADATEWVTMR